MWDSGPGIAPGQQQLIFEKFSRGDKESTVPGVGLGLAICQAVITLHEGTIHAENRPQGGVRFVITLPLTAPPLLEDYTPM